MVNSALKKGMSMKAVRKCHSQFFRILVLRLVPGRAKSNFPFSSETLAPSGHCVNGIKQFIFLIRRFDEKQEVSTGLCACCSRYLQEASQ